MSKMVVGMNSSPAIIPQRIDCGLRNTTDRACVAPFSQSSRRATGASLGRSIQRTPPMTRPATPIPAQNACQETPDAISGPTTNCPAEPPAMPNIWVNPISVAARDGGKFVVAI